MIGIIGYGFVGKAVAQLSEVYDVEIYDPYVEGYDSLKAFKQKYVFVCVPTPVRDNGTYDLSIVEDTARKWAEMRTPDSILILKSTISPGTTERLCKELYTNRIVHNPEFLTQRTAMMDFRNPLEVIVGGHPGAVAEVLAMYKGYYPFGDQDPKYIATEAKVAELVKIVRNSYYATKVSFFNEISDLCWALDVEYIDFRKVFTLEGEHPWVSAQHTMVPGPDGQMGFGGACLPKDSKNLANFARSKGKKLRILESAIRSSNRRRNETK